MAKKTSRILPNDIFKPALYVMTRKVDDRQLVLLDMNRSNRYYQLDLWVAKLWQKIDGKKTVSKLISLLAKESKSSEEVIRMQVLSALKDFSKLKLIERK